MHKIRDKNKLKEGLDADPLNSEQAAFLKEFREELQQAITDKIPFIVEELLNSGREREAMEFLKSQVETDHYDNILRCVRKAIRILGGKFREWMVSDNALYPVNAFLRGEALIQEGSMVAGINAILTALQLTKDREDARELRYRARSLIDPGSVTKPYLAEKHEAIRKALSARDYEEALRHATTASNRRYGNEDMFFMMLALEVEPSDPAEFLQEMKYRNSKNAYPLLILASRCYESGEAQNFLLCLEKALEISEDAEAFCYASSFAGFNEEADRLILQVIKEDPTNTKILELRERIRISRRSDPSEVDIDLN